MKFDQGGQLLRLVPEGEGREQSDDDGNCKPICDLCYLDGGHDWTIDLDWGWADKAPG